MDHLARLKRIIDALSAATHNDNSASQGGNTQAPATKTSGEQMFAHMYGDYDQ